MSRETLYQSVAMVDRVLEACSIPVPCVQLLAVTCLLIATKLEEQQPVKVRSSGDLYLQRREEGIHYMHHKKPLNTQETRMRHGNTALDCIVYILWHTK